MSDIIERIVRIHPERGDVIALHLSGATDLPDDLKVSLSELAKDIGVSFLVLPDDARLEELDDAEMARGGWIRVEDDVLHELVAGAQTRAERYDQQAETS